MINKGTTQEYLDKDVINIAVFTGEICSKFQDTKGVFFYNLKGKSMPIYIVAYTLMHDF